MCDVKKQKKTTNLKLDKEQIEKESLLTVDDVLNKSSNCYKMINNNSVSECVHVCGDFYIIIFFY